MTQYQVQDTGGPLVVGFDGGGTSLRVAVADLGGQVLSEARGGGINPNSGGDPEPTMTKALAEALSALPTSAKERIVAGVAGLAGVLSNPVVLPAAANAAWSANGLSAPLEVVSDLVVAFWSGVDPDRVTTPVNGGAVLIAGTGAVAARVDGADLVTTIDGYGYLLGDRGAGIWLGMRAAQAALDGLTGRGPQTLLTELVLEGRTKAEFVSSVYHGTPSDLGRYAVAVDGAVEQGDEVAVGITRDATDELLTTVEALPGGSGPIVLVGSVAVGDNPVGNLLRESLEMRGYDVLVGRSGLRGALTLASRGFEDDLPLT